MYRLPSSSPIGPSSRRTKLIGTRKRFLATLHVFSRILPSLVDWKRAVLPENVFVYLRTSCVCLIDQLEKREGACTSFVLRKSILFFLLKGEVRTINDRNICERRSCMKNNGKSPTFKFVSGEERRPSEVQRVSWGWRLPGATYLSADLTWIRKWLEIQAPELSELESVELELGSCCSNLDKQVLDEICRTRKRQFEIPFRL